MCRDGDCCVILNVVNVPLIHQSRETIYSQYEVSFKYSHAQSVASDCSLSSYFPTPAVVPVCLLDPLDLWSSVVLKVMLLCLQLSMYCVSTNWLCTVLHVLFKALLTNLYFWYSVENWWCKPSITTEICVWLTLPQTLDVPFNFQHVSQKTTIRENNLIQQKEEVHSSSNRIGTGRDNPFISRHL